MSAEPSTKISDTFYDVPIKTCFGERVPMIGLFIDSILVVQGIKRCSLLSENMFKNKSEMQRYVNLLLKDRDDLVFVNIGDNLIMTSVDWYINREGWKIIKLFDTSRSESLLASILSIPMSFPVNGGGRPKRDKLLMVDCQHKKYHYPLLLCPWGSKALIAPSSNDMINKIKQIGSYYKNVDIKVHVDISFKDDLSVFSILNPIHPINGLMIDLISCSEKYNSSVYKNKLQKTSIEFIESSLSQSVFDIPSVSSCGLIFVDSN